MVIDTTSPVLPDDIIEQRTLETFEIVKNVGNTSNRSKEQQIEAKNAIDTFHREYSEGALIAYTDGSVKNRHEKCLSKSLGYGACSSVMVHFNDCKNIKVSTGEVGVVTNNVECEVEGIALALKETSMFFKNVMTSKEHRKAYVLSDCKAAIDIVCLQNNISYRTDTLRQIWSSLKDLECRNVTTKIAWCPGHCDIELNEVADMKAKEKAEILSAREDRNNHNKINVETMKKIIKEHQIQHWQKAWEHSGSSRHTKDLIPSVRTKTRWSIQRCTDISYARMDMIVKKCAIFAIFSVVWVFYHHTFLKIDKRLINIGRLSLMIVLKFSENPMLIAVGGLKL